MLVNRTVGATEFEWEAEEPLQVEVRGEVGPVKHRRIESFTFNLSDLRSGYTDSFLINLRDLLFDRAGRLKLGTLSKEAQNLRKTLWQVWETGAFKEKISIIDEMFLLCLSVTAENLATYHLRYLQILFNWDPDSPLFARGLHASDFPSRDPKKGTRGSAIDRIIAKAMTRASVAVVLDSLDRAYAQGIIDIGHYSLGHLCFAVFSRNESYRQITLGDLKFDAKSQQHFIDIVPSKSRMHAPTKIRYRVSEALALLLAKQRQAVIEKYGHIVSESDIEKLALFPARQLTEGGAWKNTFSNENYGMYSSASQFALGYQRAIQVKLGEHIQLGNNQLRHTLGTLLAQTGASAKTIQAVLKHSTDSTCKYYVDIAFHGLMFELSESMKPAFAEHLPTLMNIRSKKDAVAQERRISAEDGVSGRFEDVGECGKAIVCESAPIACYGCFRFNPCWDADHSINLRLVEGQIAEMSRRGKPFQHLVDKARQAKIHIVLVMNAIDLLRNEQNGETKPL